MVNDAKKYKQEDKQQKERITAKNQLESYPLKMKTAVENENMNGKKSEDDKKTILDKCNEIISWLDSIQFAETEENAHKQTELQGVCNPIIIKLKHT
ncbi:hypothetical protein DPMN_194834 [Dreissena polymorpha]|uniref:Heat shock cognate 71 kDa protein n=1 Tax=Dreissena polymorpha TaxID=45954 RepID=A0A9D3Y3B7_DREPO|nr:hypothetical protein DPMN_194834 [Dreissena polymorpha]